MMRSREIETPRGTLRVTWPDPQPVYGEDVIALAYDPLQDRTPLVTLNGVEIDAGQAGEIIREMRGTEDNRRVPRATDDELREPGSTEGTP